ncbi:MAG TPA: site-2 protease family protein [Candidatus Acidoferrales bacterium]|nr:site-2 protease family protein [Candidatus Acidoferrales bacterium]
MSDGSYTIEQPPLALAPPIKRRVVLPLVLFLLTVLSTLYVGGAMQRAYDSDRPAVSEDTYAVTFHFSDLLDGWPFALTLLGILLAHELGHFFAARHYGIVASYPYFIPAPTLIGTMGAFIRIQSPIWNRRALFDVGIAGPLVGFVLAVPALAFGLMHSRVVPATGDQGNILLGDPPLVWAMSKLIWPDVASDTLLLHPIAFAAWVGLFATALNLLPVGQLDGGHIIFALSAEKHRRLSRVFTLLLLMGGLIGWKRPDLIWPGWLVWGVLLLFLGVRHPPVVDPYEGLDTRRRWVAFIGLVVFLLCFTPTPFRVVQP